MKQAIQKFMTNSDFHNPLTDKKKSLLSTKEKWKGSFLPLIGFGGIMLASTGVALGMGVFASFAQSVALLAIGSIPFVEVNQRFRRHRLGKRAKIYNFDKEEDKEAFRNDYPFHPYVPENMVAMSKEAGLQHTPELAVHHDNHIGAFSYQGSFFDRKNGIAFADKSDINGSQAELLATMGHEIAHLKHKDMGLASFTSNRVLPATVIGMSFGIGIELIMTGGLATVAKGVAYIAAGCLGGEVCMKKISQYTERRADRTGAILSGKAEAEGAKFMADSFHRNETVLNSDSLKGKFSDTFQRLRSTHPKSYDRGMYMFEFAKANKDYCIEQQKKYKQATFVKQTVI